jgi:phage anti-repressor protein
MGDLIKINFQQGGKQTVSARELYEKLGFNTAHWARWSRQNIEDNPFALKGQDFEGFAIMVNGNPTQDFDLSIDFAKRLCMMARTEMGEKIRNYFIEVEKRHTAQIQAQSIEDLIIMQATSMKELRTQVSQMQDKLQTTEHRLSNLDGTNIDGTPRQRLVKMVNRIAYQEGVTHSKAWDIFKQSYNTAFHTNLEIRLNHHRDVTGKIKCTIPEYLEDVGEINDGLRVADKLINKSA